MRFSWFDMSVQVWIPVYAGMTWTAATGGMDSRLRGNDVDGAGMTGTAATGGMDSRLHRNDGDSSHGWYGFPPTRE